MEETRSIRFVAPYICIHSGMSLSVVRIIILLKSSLHVPFIYSLVSRPCVGKRASRLQCWLSVVLWGLLLGIVCELCKHCDRSLLHFKSILSCDLGSDPNGLCLSNCSKITINTSVLVNSSSFYGTVEKCTPSPIPSTIPGTLGIFKIVTSEVISNALLSAIPTVN